jgi:hypothetical protein
VPYATLVANGQLPLSALFSSTAPAPTGNAVLDAALAVPTTTFGSTGFGSPNLVTNSLRVDYGRDALASPDGAFPTLLPGVPQAVAPLYPLRVALKKNDLRNWSPNGTAPIQLCGGHNDPTVWYGVNTGTMAAYWANLVASGTVKVLDVDPDSTPPLQLVNGFYSRVQSAASSAFAADLNAKVSNPATYGSDVTAAILALYPATVASSPDGYFLQALTQYVASIAVNDAQYSLANHGVNTFPGDVATFLVGNYHAPLAELACAHAARDFFNTALQDAARHRHGAGAGS